MEATICTRHLFKAGGSVGAGEYHAEVYRRHGEIGRNELVDEVAVVSHYSALHARGRCQHAVEAVLEQHFVEEVDKHVGQGHGHGARHGDRRVRLVEVEDVDVLLHRHRKLLRHLELARAVAEQDHVGGLHLVEEHARMDCGGVQSRAAGETRALEGGYVVVHKRNVRSCVEGRVGRRAFHVAVPDDEHLARVEPGHSGQNHAFSAAQEGEAVLSIHYRGSSVKLVDYVGKYGYVVVAHHIVEASERNLVFKQRGCNLLLEEGVVHHAEQRRARTHLEDVELSQRRVAEHDVAFQSLFAGADLHSETGVSLVGETDVDASVGLHDEPDSRRAYEAARFGSEQETRLVAVGIVSDHSYGEETVSFRTRRRLRLGVELHSFLFICHNINGLRLRCVVAAKAVDISKQTKLRKNPCFRKSRPTDRRKTATFLTVDLCDAGRVRGACGVCRAGASPFPFDEGIAAGGKAHARQVVESHVRIWSASAQPSFHDPRVLQGNRPRLPVRLHILAPDLSK